MVRLPGQIRLVSWNQSSAKMNSDFTVVGRNLFVAILWSYGTCEHLGAGLGCRPSCTSQANEHAWRIRPSGPRARRGSSRNGLEG